MPLGFILHPTYYIEKGRPIVHLFGKDENGESFVVRDDRARPHFYIATEDLPRARKISDLNVEECDWKSVDGREVARVFVGTPPEAPLLRDQLQSSGIATFEADIPFATTFLIERGIRGALRIEGASRSGRLLRHVYQNPEISPAEWIPTLAAVSIDIETDPEARQIYSIALYAEGVREVLIIGDPVEAGNITVQPCVDERELCARFARRLREIDPDILTGWNVIDFDLKVLEEAFTRTRVPFNLGRADLPCKLRLETGIWGSSRAIIPGRVVLDALSLVRDSFIRLDDYRLETAAQEILGRGKVIHSEDRAEEITNAFLHDRERFVRYNLVDCELVSEILAARNLLDLTIRRSLLTGMPLDRVGGSIATFDFLYLSELHAAKTCAITVPEGRVSAPTQGGFVLDSLPGLYDRVGVFDFRSLYPSLIRTFRLDPLAVIPRGHEPKTGAPITTPNGARFEREGGILPKLLDDLFPRREQALRENDTRRAQAIKILMNSFYGVLGTPRCRFYSPETANAITSLGQKILRWTRDTFEKRGLPVLYGDTDSLFVDLGAEPSEDAALDRGRTLAAELNREIAESLAREYDVESRLELRFERLYTRLLLPALRGSSQGSKKRYVGLIREDGEERLHFVGLESVRRDWTEVAKQYQRELVRRVFADEPVEEFTRQFLDRLRAGGFDEDLVYRRALRKSTEEYTSTTPPHVQAAMKMSRPPGRIIAYVFTIDGPEPADERKHPLDYEHYVEKQVRPIAESILSLIGLDWDKVTGMQGTLF
ncbi:MAG: DNA polymerase II [Candidatus Eisenbacteria bacterium]|uniref:DNA polymerase n=1 Tax=Eiseniibacteriota bacterium TaxID=2212470 RepID=A0A956LZ21_UNCEI|nr:DNA polymerase II [Candidatus Eisenbacteria bacterium]